METSQLIQTHKDYKIKADTFNKLTLLYNGGAALKEQASQFIVRRPDEPLMVYNYRLQHVTYTNLIATYIQEHVNRLAAAPLTYNSMGSEDQFWQSLRVNIDGAGSDDLTLLSELAKHVMLYGEGYLYHTYIDTQPLIRTLDPRNIIDWQYDRLDRLVFIKHKSGNIYTLFYPDRVEVYELNPDNYTDQINPSLVTATAQLAVQQVRVKTADVYIGKSLYLPAVEHFELECKLYDLFTFAYVQRTVQPLPEPTVDAYNLPALDVRSNEYALPAEFKTGNPYVIAANGFQFVELEGRIATPIKERLEQLRYTMANAAYQGAVYANSSAANNVSGISKSVDFVKQAMFLGKLGSLLLRSYQNVLNTIADELGYGFTDVNGFSNFNLFKQVDLEAILSNETLFNKLPAAAQAELVSQYVSILLPNSDLR